MTKENIRNTLIRMVQQNKLRQKEEIQRIIRQRQEAAKKRYVKLKKYTRETWQAKGRKAKKIWKRKKVADDKQQEWQ